MKFLRPVLAVAAALLSLGLLGHPAYADDPAYSAGQHVDTGLHLRLDDYGRFGTFSYSVDSADDSDAEEAVAAYCFDLDLRYRPGAALLETDWDDLPNAASHIDEVNWLLHNSYPMLALEQVQGTAEFHDGLSVREAVAATQAAIWHYTNGISLNASDVVGTADQQQDVMSLYSYLTGPQKTGFAASEPDTLSLTAPDTNGVAGQPIGPIVLTTDIPALLSIDAANDDWRLVDADGTPIDGPVESTEVYLEITPDAAPGEVTINAVADTELPTARIFVPAYTDPGTTTQPLITPAIRPVTLQATVTVSWTAAPTVDPEPPTTEPEPPITEPEPPVIDPEEPTTEPEPPATEPEPVVDEPEPPVVEPEPAVTDPKPAVVPVPPAAAATPANVTPVTAHIEPLADTGADAGRWALVAGSAILIGSSGILLARRGR